MKWLVTTDERQPPEKFAQVLEALGCDVPRPLVPTPLSGGEIAVEVEGPTDLPRRARKKPEIHGVFPSSEMSLY